MREFETGATRDTADGKPELAKYLSPLVIKRFGEYMLKHQIQPDGQKRTGDNWKKGMPLDSYLDSGFRHFLDWWLIHDGHEGREDIETALCALLFNVQGYLHEILKSQIATSSADNPPPVFTEAQLKLMKDGNHTLVLTASDGKVYRVAPADILPTPVEKRSDIGQVAPDEFATYKVVPDE